MKITKRRVTKRNRIKRKYSKKRTKTRHSRKRVFSKKRRKTIKKKKRGGMGLKLPRLKLSRLKLPQLIMTKEEKARIDLEEAKNKLQKSINDFFELEETKKHFLDLHDEIITNTKNANNKEEKYNIYSTYDTRVIEKLISLKGINYNEMINDQAKKIYNNNNIDINESNLLKGYIKRMFNLKIEDQKKNIIMNIRKLKDKTEINQNESKYGADKLKEIFSADELKEIFSAD